MACVRPEQNQQPQGVIKVADVSLVEPMETGHKKKKYGFGIQTHKRLYVCAAETAAVRDAWIRTLNEASRVASAKRDQMMKEGLLLAHAFLAPGTTAGAGGASSDEGDVAPSTGTIVVKDPKGKGSVAASDAAPVSPSAASSSPGTPAAAAAVAGASAAAAPAAKPKPKPKPKPVAVEDDEEGNSGTMVRMDTKKPGKVKRTERTDSGTMVVLDAASGSGSGSADADGTMVRMGTSQKLTGSSAASKQARKPSGDVAKPAFLRYLDEQSSPVVKEQNWDAFSVEELDQFIKAIEAQRVKEMQYITKQFEQMRVAVLAAMSDKT